MSYGGGSGGSGSIHASSDVALSNPSDGQVLTFSASLAKWQNATAATGGAVSSVAGRTGAVVLTAADVSGTVAATSIGAANGVAGLDGSSKLAIANLPLSVPVVVSESSGSYPNRPAYVGSVWFRGPDQPATGGTISGGNGAVSGLDVWFKTAS